MRECEDCEDEVKGRRLRCYHCGLLVCGWCWGHVHGCGPSHTRAECRDYQKAMTLTPKERKRLWVVKRNLAASSVHA